MFPSSTQILQIMNSKIKVISYAAIWWTRRRERAEATEPVQKEGEGGGGLLGS